jgi:hypothetical protein
MPKYQFYHLPPGAKDMSFGNLFINCGQQGENAGWSLAPLIVEDWYGDNVPVASAKIPVPEHLGDLVKLLDEIPIPLVNQMGEPLNVEPTPWEDAEPTGYEMLETLLGTVHQTEICFKAVQPELAILLNKYEAVRNTTMRDATQVIQHLYELGHHG